MTFEQQWIEYDFNPFIQGDSAKNTTQAHKVPAVPGAKRLRPEPKPSANKWAGWASMKRSVGLEAKRLPLGSVGYTVSAWVMR